MPGPSGIHADEFVEVALDGTQRDTCNPHNRSADSEAQTQDSFYQTRSLLPRGASKVAAVQICRRVSQVYPIEHIVGIEAKLQVHALGDNKFFLQGEIYLRETWTEIGAAAERAIRPQC